jgi:hypothetical protein
MKDLTPFENATAAAIKITIGSLLLAAFIWSCAYAYGDDPASPVGAAPPTTYAPSYTPTRLSVDRYTQRTITVTPAVKLAADLERLAGPVCPVDGLRAIEHLRFERDRDATVMTTTHDGWPQGRAWLDAFWLRKIAKN